MRTYSRETYLKAQKAWADGEFGPAWMGIRIAAGERGFLFPPAGTPHDDRDAESPSQRAIIWRALQDNPRKLSSIVWRCSSWSEVIDRIIGMEGQARADYVEPDKSEGPSRREAMDSLRRILGREDAA